MSQQPRYRILERIDAGGMAEVFRGVAESLQGFKKNVAIKRILPHLTKNKKFVSMFLDEARLSLHLQHANIVAVFDIGVAPPVGDQPGSYFIVMEYVDGTNLKGVIESLRRTGRRLRVAEALYLMMEVCRGLAYAHDAVDEHSNPLGIVHRDVSPPNILMSKNGEVKIVDFGLAKATSQLEQTDPGVVKGKFSYLSPEGASGLEVDNRADIFSVGALTYELLTGRRLFYGESDLQTVELVRLARVPSIAAQNPDVDAELEAIVRRALTKDVGARYQHAAEFQDALAQYLFSRGLKVTSRDIGRLVQETVREKASAKHAEAAAGPPAQKGSLIDALIQEEMLKFTSLDELDLDASPPGAIPLVSPVMGSGPVPAATQQKPNQFDGGAASSPRFDGGTAPGPRPGRSGGMDLIDPRLWGEDSINEATQRRRETPAHGTSSPPPSPSPRPATPADARSAAGSSTLARKPPVPPHKQSGIKELAKELEGDVSQRYKTPPEAEPAPRGKDGGLGFWIALVALLLVGTGAVFFIVSMRVAGHH